MRIHYLQHVPFEGPGNIQSWANEHGFKLKGTRLFMAEELPDPDAIDGLIIMGGPMSVHDEKLYPWLRKEKQFIHECIKREKKVLGICLGAQLISDTLAAKVTPMVQKEIGWFPLIWTDVAQNHPLFNYLPKTHVVLHWHGEQFDIPDNSLHIAFNEACVNQAFLYQKHVLGLQFHLEMTREGLADLIANSEEELKSAGGSWIQSPEEMINTKYFADNNFLMEKLLERFFRT